jgi:hypothetical protein
MLGTSATDAVNRAPRASYSEVTGLTQTARNFGASLGLAVLGALLISRDNTNITGALVRHGVPKSAAEQVAGSFGWAAAATSGPGGRSHALVHDVQLAFAHSTQTICYVMAGVMAASFLVALGLPRGRLEQPAPERTLASEAA